jgi:predicted ATPase
LTLVEKAEETRGQKLSELDVIRERQRVEHVISRLIYISAVRGGAEVAYPSRDAQVTNVIGAEGQYAPFWYDQLVDDEVPPERRHPDEPAPSFRKQVDAWIGALFPGAQANVQSLPQISMFGLQFRLSNIGAWRRPANIGYGLTYAFPILVSLLAASKGTIIVIDSPEAHLHPSAQSKMGRVLAHFAKSGVQIIVETHSDHLLNGARLAIKEGQLPNNSLRIHFFTAPTPTSHGVISPIVDADGRIYEWPAGFFDQSEKDLSLLATWE